VEVPDIIIAILDAEPEGVDGRTAIQKLVYFTSVKTGIDAGFIPHYYGPFSPLVAAYLENLVSLEFITEQGRRTIRDRTMYSYFLTQDGKKVADLLKKKYPEKFSEVEKVVKKCRKIVHNNIYVLSWAAKVHFILRQAEKPMTYGEAIEASKSFGWSLSEEEIESAAKLLLALGLIKKE